jgi:hypothetical protein
MPRIFQQLKQSPNPGILKLKQKTLVSDNSQTHLLIFWHLEKKNHPYQYRGGTTWGKKVG